MILGELNTPNIDVCLQVKLTFAVVALCTLFMSVLTVVVACRHDARVICPIQIGQSCDYPHNLWTGAHLIAQEAQLVNATSQTIMAG